MPFPDGPWPSENGLLGPPATWSRAEQDGNEASAGAGAVRMVEDDPRWQSPAQPHGLTRLQRDPDPDGAVDPVDPDEFGAGAEVWTVRRSGEPWAGAAVQRWCADCRAWTHVVDAGVPVDWYADDRCATCSRGFPLDPTA